MYSVTVSEKVHKSIIAFIDSYRETFLELFTDTGIFDEQLIREHYIQSSEKFQIEFFELIEDTLKQNLILGRKEISQNKYECISQIGNYRLFLYYSENLEKYSRYLEDIELHKK